MKIHSIILFHKTNIKTSSKKSQKGREQILNQFEIENMDDPVVPMPSTSAAELNVSETKNTTSK